MTSHPHYWHISSIQNARTSINNLYHEVWNPWFTTKWLRLSGASGDLLYVKFDFYSGLKVSHFVVEMLSYCNIFNLKFMMQASKIRTRPWPQKNWHSWPPQDAPSTSLRYFQNESVCFLHTLSTKHHTNKKVHKAQVFTPGSKTQLHQPSAPLLQNWSRDQTSAGQAKCLSQAQRQGEESSRTPDSWTTCRPSFAFPCC